MSLSSGVKITADVDDLTRKLDYAMGRIDREVTNLQKKAGVHATVCGDLVNRYGQLVEGLNLTQIKLGQYVDEMGTVHTANGEFVADLNKVEQALGFYADELGNVYNRQGKYIRQTADARKAVEEKIKADNEAFEAGQRSAVVLSSALSGISNSFGQLANTFVTLNTSGDLSSFGKKLLTISQTISTFAGTFQGTNGLIKGFKDAAQSSKNLFSSLGKTSAEAGNKLKGLRGVISKLGPAFAALGGPVGLAVAGVTAIGAGIMAYKASNNVNDKISDSFKELEKRARGAGDSIKSVGDALKYGAFSESLSEFETVSQKLATAEEALKRAKEEAKKAMERAVETAKYGGIGSGEAVAFAGRNGEKDIENAEADRKNAWAEYNGVVAKMIDAAREEQKTEVDRLEEQLKAFRDIEEYAQGTEALTVVQKQIGIFEEKIKEAKAREAEQAANEAEKAKQERLKAAGVLDYLKKAESAAALGTTLEDFNENVKKWNESVAKGDLTQEELNKAVEAYKNDVVARLGQEVGVDFSKMGEGEGVDPFQRLENARNTVLTEEKYVYGLNELRKQNAEKLRAELLAGLTVETYSERLQELQKECGERRITEEALNQISAELGDAYKELKEEAKEKAGRELGVEFGNDGAERRSFETKLRRLNELLHEATINQNEYKNALAQLKENALDSILGYTELKSALNDAESEEEKHKKLVEALNDAYDKGILGQEELNKLLAREKELREEKQKQEAEAKRNETRSSLGLESFIAAGEKEKTEREKLEEQYDKIRKAYREGAITQEEMNAATKSYKAQRDELNKKEKAAAEQRIAQYKEGLRSQLGVDSLMESLKTPLEKYWETMETIEKATRAAAISEEERAALANKAADDYWDAMRPDSDLGDDTRTARRNELGKSMSAGSEALYLAQVKNTTANYQSRIQTTTENLYRNSQEALYQAQQTNLYLQDVVANAAPVFFG